LIRTGEFANMHYAGKKGFTPISAKKRFRPTLNLWQLSAMVDRLIAEKNAQLAGEKVLIDLKQLGYEKLLGAGSVSRAIQVNIKCSETAAKKLKDAGGEIVTGNVTK
jgi:large subunit ribosomal protein L15